MKKILFSVIAIFTIVSVNAQKKRSTTKSEDKKEKLVEYEKKDPVIIQSSKGENYLPEAGDWAIGFNANSIFKNLARSLDASNATPPQGEIFLQQGAFVGKYFTDEAHAYRVIVNLGFGSNTTTNSSITNDTVSNAKIQVEQEVKVNQFDIQIGLGKEWRRGKTRLQGFYGADALIGFNTGKDSETNVDSKIIPSSGSIVSFSQNTATNLGSTFTIGVNGFIGGEYFIAPKLAIGAQYNWGLGIALNGKGTQTISATNVPDVESEIGGKNTTFFLGGFSKDNTVGFGTASLNLTLHF
jgi:hypothetical protein